MFKWLFGRKKTEADYATEVKAEEGTGQKTPDTKNRPARKTEPGRIIEKGELPGPSPSFQIEYTGKEPIKPEHKVLLSNGYVLRSSWYTHPWLGTDGWMKQDAKYSIPKIKKMVEKDTAAARKLYGETIRDRIERREKEKQVQSQTGTKVPEQV